MPTICFLVLLTVCCYQLLHGVIGVPLIAKITVTVISW